MNPILQVVAGHLKSLNLRFGLGDEGEDLFLTVARARLVWTIQFNTNEPPTLLTLLSQLPARMPAASRPQCCRILAARNYGRRIGAWHLDLEDGEVLFCISAPVPEETISEDLIQQLLGHTLQAMDEHGPDLLRLALQLQSTPVAPEGPARFQVN